MDSRQKFKYALAAMTEYHITGKTRLTGEVTIQGSKNAVLPLLAAGLLFDQGLSISNVPAISDVEVMSQLLKNTGAAVSGSNESITIHPGKLKNPKISEELATRLRASVLLLGPLLARLGKVELPLPGGDLIGRRPINTHLRALEQMGAKVRQTAAGYSISGKLTGTDIYLDEASVTATENVLMAAALAHGSTTIRNAAQEDHVRTLAETLRSGGVDITGIGSSTLFVRGTGGQPLTQHVRMTVPPDELDAGTFAIAALITQGDITIDPYPIEALRPFTEKLIQAGAEINFPKLGAVRVHRSGREILPFSVKVGPAPGFPTDLQPLMTVLATQAEGVSLIHDWMYERRFGYVEQLERFGASITVCDPHRVTVSGPRRLTGQRIISPDIRAGIAFVLAALSADGESIIEHAEIIERGYANLTERLAKLGAKITRKVKK